MASTGSQTLTDTLAAEAPPSCARALSDSNLGEGRKTWRGVVSSGYMGGVAYKLPVHVGTALLPQ